MNHMKMVWKKGREHPTFFIPFAIWKGVMWLILAPLVVTSLFFRSDALLAVLVGIGLVHLFVLSGMAGLLRRLEEESFSWTWFWTEAKRGYRRTLGSVLGAVIPAIPVIASMIYLVTTYVYSSSLYTLIVMGYGVLFLLYVNGHAMIVTVAMNPDWSVWKSIFHVYRLPTTITLRMWGGVVFILVAFTLFAALGAMIPLFGLITVMGAQSVATSVLFLYLHTLLTKN